MKPDYRTLLGLDLQRAAYAERAHALADAVASIYAVLRLSCGPDAELSAILDVLARRQAAVADRLVEIDEQERAFDELLLDAGGGTQ